MTRPHAMDWRLFALVFILVAAIFVARAYYSFGEQPLLADTDDAMRLVVVRDLLAGQGWYDNVQHRLNTPFGAELHWSRLADLPLAFAFVTLEPILGGMAETAAVMVVPLLLLAVLLYLSGRVALALKDREALLPAFILPAFSVSVLAEFAPGRVDHHSVQILLLMALVWLSIEALEHHRLGWWAGIVAATGIAIGIEALPTLMAAIAAFGLMWVGRPERAAAMRNFGLAFAGATTVHLLIGVAPERWFAPACDALSFTYAAAALFVGAGLTALSLLPLKEQSPWPRLLVGGLVGGAAAGLTVALFPECLRGPYAALDPWLVSNWLAGISEVTPLWQSAFENPVYALAVAVPPFVALCASAAAIMWGPHERRDAFWVFATFLVVAVAVMFVQVRSSRLATPLAIPACAWLIVVARHHYLSRKNLRRVAPLVLAWLGSAGIAVGVAGGLVINALPGGTALLEARDQSSRHACLMPDAFATLAAMPPQRVITPIDLGAHTLMFTEHAVVAAPYHRNQQGVRDTFAFLNDPLEDARAIIEARDIGLVVICPGMPEMRGLASAAPDSFVQLWADGELPDWLERLVLGDGPLEAYRVQR